MHQRARAVVHNKQIYCNILIKYIFAASCSGNGPGDGVSVHIYMYPHKSQQNLQGLCRHVKSLIEGAKRVLVSTVKYEHLKKLQNCKENNKMIKCGTVILQSCSISNQQVQFQATGKLMHII